MFWEHQEWEIHVFVSVEGCTEVKTFVSMHIYVQFYVLKTLFHRILDAVRSAVLVVSSPG